MADLSTEITALEMILNSGARSVTIDGVTTTFENADQLRRRIRELRAVDDTDKGRRPTLARINLSKTVS